MSITVAARPKAWTLSVRSNTDIAGSNPTGAMDVSVHLFSLCFPVCRQGPCDGLIHRPKSPTVHMIKKTENEAKTQQKGLYSLIKKDRENTVSRSWNVSYSVGLRAFSLTRRKVLRFEDQSDEITAPGRCNASKLNISSDLQIWKAGLKRETRSLVRNYKACFQATGISFMQVLYFYFHLTMV
jgi:hypothetical protein